MPREVTTRRQKHLGKCSHLRDLSAGRWRCSFIRESLVHGLANHAFYFLAKARCQALRVLKNELAHHLTQAPVQHQVHPLQHALHHLLLQVR